MSGNNFIPFSGLKKDFYDKNVLNTVLEGNDQYSYSDMQTIWDRVKNNPNHPNYEFLAPIFAFEDKGVNSKKVFNAIANLDGKTAVIGKEDIKKLSFKYQDSNDLQNYDQLSGNDFAELYKSMGIDFDINNNFSERNVQYFHDYDKDTEKYSGIDFKPNKDTNILDNLAHDPNDNIGRYYSYSELENVWNEIKNDPTNPNYKFLAPIFAFEDKGYDSEEIFNKIAGSDGENITVSHKDLRELSYNFFDGGVDKNVDSQIFNDYDSLSFKDYEDIYDKMRSDDSSLQKLNQSDFETENIPTLNMYDPERGKYTEGKKETPSTDDNDVLNSVAAGSLYTYSELKETWEQVKNDKDHPDYEFLAPIFAFDENGENKSKKIFEEIAGLYGDEESVSNFDMQRLGDLEGTSLNTKTTQDQSIISYEDYEIIYKQAGLTDDKGASEIIFDDFTDKDINALHKYDSATGKYIGEDETLKELQDNTDATIDKIMNSNAPEAQKYKELINDIGRDNIKTDDHYDNAFGYYDHKSKDIHIVASKDEMFDESSLMRTLLHELNHYEDHYCEDKDRLNSAMEEIDVETDAINDAKAILGSDSVYATPKDDSNHLQEYTELYTNIVEQKFKYITNAGEKYSPGHGAPKNIGMRLTPEVADNNFNFENDFGVSEQYDWQGNKITYITDKTAHGALLDDGTQVQDSKYKIVYGDDGLPEKANKTRIYTDKNGKKMIEIQRYSDYNKQTHEFETIGESMTLPYGFFNKFLYGFM